MIDPPSHADINTVLISVSSVSLAVVAYFLKRVMDCIDGVERTQVKDGNRLTVLETIVLYGRRRDDEPHHHTSGPHPQEG